MMSAVAQPEVQTSDSRLGAGRLSLEATADGGVCISSLPLCLILLVRVLSARKATHRLACDIPVGREAGKQAGRQV